MKPTAKQLKQLLQITGTGLPWHVSTIDRETAQHVIDNAMEGNKATVRDVVTSFFPEWDGEPQALFKQEESKQEEHKEGAQQEYIPEHGKGVLDALSILNETLQDAILKAVEQDKRTAYTEGLAKGIAQGKQEGNGQKHPANTGPGQWL